MEKEETILEKTDKEQIREQKRAINRSKRNLEREKRKLLLNKKKMLIEIKKMAKKGQTIGAKMLAKDIIRLTNKINKIEQIIGQLIAISMRISYCSSFKEIEEAMNNIVNALTTVRNILDSQKINDAAKQLIKENMKLDLKSEIIQNILDGIGESLENEEVEEDLIKQVLKEVNIEDEMIDIEKGKEKETNKKIENKPQKLLLE